MSGPPTSPDSTTPSANTEPHHDASLPLTHKRLSREHICTVMGKLGETFRDIPYALAGRSALVYYGYHSINVPHISIMCPFPTARVILTWVRANGLAMIPNQPTGFIMPTGDDQPGAVVYVRGTSENFYQMAPIMDTEHSVYVVTLASLANRIAKMYIRIVKKGCGRCHQEALRQDMAWTLCRIIELGMVEHQFPRDYPPRYINDPEFWGPFSAAFPYMVVLFQMLGLHLDRPFRRQATPFAWPSSPLTTEYRDSVTSQHGRRVSVESIHDPDEIRDITPEPI